MNDNDKLNKIIKEFHKNHFITEISKTSGPDPSFET